MKNFDVIAGAGLHPAPFVLNMRSKVITLLLRYFFVISLYPPSQKTTGVSPSDVIPAGDHRMVKCFLFCFGGFHSPEETDGYLMRLPAGEVGKLGELYFPRIFC